MNEILIIIGVILMIIGVFPENLRYPENIVLAFIGAGIAFYGAC